MLTSRRIRLLISAGLAGLLGGLLLQVNSALSPASPPLQEDCGNCHVSGSKTSKKDARLLLATQEQLCATCHPGAVEASHPSGLKPTMNTPAKYPLDWKGELTCSSCHFIHQGGHGRLRASGRTEQFCLSCHPRDFFARMADGGGSLALSGHLDASTRHLQMPGLDSYSAQCMTCHDEKGESPELRVMLDSGGLARHGGNSLNHPVGRDYSNAVDFGGYRRRGLLPASIVLPEGKISCVSCHQGYSSQHGAMVASTRGSELCFQCHDL